MVGRPADPERMARLDALTRSCALCGNRCGVDRVDPEAAGVCAAGPLAEVVESGPHLGVEPPIRGTRGCGHIHFTGCSLACVFCRGGVLDPERARPGEALNPVELADRILGLQDQGVHCVDLVSATAHLRTVVPALESARVRGLRIPVVYTSSAYETVEALGLLEGLVDVYLPELKYGSDRAGAVLSGIPDYATVSRDAVREMLRQVGALRLDPEGLARRGLLVRHPVLPSDRADSLQALRWIASALGPDTHVSLLAQYRPERLAAGGMFPGLDRPLAESDYRFVVDFAEGLGLRNLYLQETPRPEGSDPDLRGAESPLC